MNYKIVSSVTQLTRRAIYTFSKNPFDKFKRKVSPAQTPKSNQPQGQSHPEKERKPVSRIQKLNQNKLNSKTNIQEKQKSNALSSSAFKKFRNFRDELSNKGHEKDKQQSNFKTSDGSSQHKNSESSKKIVENSSNQVSNEAEKKEKTSQAFKRFTKNKISSKQQEYQQQGFKVPPKGANQMKNQQKKQFPKEKSIPKITLERNEDDQDLKSTIILRKPKHLTKNRSQLQPNQPKQQKPVDQKSESKNKEQEKKQAEMYQTQQNTQFWKQFQHKIQQYKLQKLKLMSLRFERLNLVKKKPEEKVQESKQSQQQQQPQKPINFQNIFKKMALVGAVFFLWGHYFESTKGQEVDPSYLKNALQQNKISQTWISYNEMSKDSEEQIRGKNTRQYIYVKQNNGNMYFCLSNEDFSKRWLDQIAQQNTQADARIGQYFPTKIGNQLSGVDSPPKKIIISQSKIHKNNNFMLELRKVLSFALIYYIIKSVRQASKGGKARGGDLKDIFKTQKSHRVKDAINVTFKDVVGMQKAKQEIVQFIDFLKYPEKYNKLGARIPRGALLTGPPGTGKTMIAKACAGESKVPFFSISGSQFIEMYVGVGAQRVRDLFKEAKENAPSIIFIDQIDAVGKKRSGGGFGGGNDQRDTTLNQLLVEMDGFDTNTNVIVFAATNQKQVLDQALTRPGRFDRLIEIDLPDLQGRKEIFQVHLKPIQLEKGTNISDYAKRLATLTPGFSGAEIKNVCNEAAIIAARSNKDYVSIIDFELATERIIGGVEKKSQLITEETRRTVAYHECGHGVVSWFIKNANPLLKLTIIPRSKGALGFAQYLPNQNQIYTKNKLMDQICVILGGRISEEIFFGKISTGAGDDLNKAYQIAKTLITQYGFGEKLGWVQYQETQYAKEYSKDIENKIDTQILQIMKVCSQKTRSIILQKKDLIKNLAERLLQQETIDQTVIEQVLGPRPFPISKQHQDYITEKKRMSQQAKVLQPEASSIKQPQTHVGKMKKIDYLL